MTLDPLHPAIRHPSANDPIVRNDSHLFQLVSQADGAPLSLQLQGRILLSRALVLENATITLWSDPRHPAVLDAQGHSRVLEVRAYHSACHTDSCQPLA